MKYTFVVGALIAVCGCSDGHSHGGREQNEIVFGISQVANADGTFHIAADWDMLTFAGSQLATTARVSRDRSCWLEPLGDRKGQPRVDGGVALWMGGSLPANGLAVVANQSNETDFPQAGWAGGDLLTFKAQGFAVPNVRTHTFHAPATDLAISSPSAQGTVAIPVGTDFTVTWNAASESEDDVLVALDTTPAGDALTSTELRCFFDRSAGSGALPQDLIAALPQAADGSVSGQIMIGTHRQLDVRERGGWLVYVVATVINRTQPFTLGALPAASDSGAPDGATPSDAGDEADAPDPGDAGSD